MSATNATTNYSFPIFIGTDKPAWLVDWNGAMTAIDAEIKNVDTDLGSLQTTVSGLSTTVAAHTSSISTISGQITTITTNVNSNTGAINTINSLIGNGTPTTTDQTIIGAINELHANQGDLANLTTTDKTSLVAAINELAGGGGSVAASAVTYDNSASGLAATDVQDAIDELHSSANIAYDNTVSGLSATNVKAAIDELASGGAGASWSVVGTYAAAQTGVAYDFTGATDVAIGLIDDTQTPTQLVALTTVPYSIWSSTYTNVATSYNPAGTASIGALKFVDSGHFDLGTASLGVYKIVVMAKK